MKRNSPIALLFVTCAFFLSSCSLFSAGSSSKEVEIPTFTAEETLEVHQNLKTSAFSIPQNENETFKGTTDPAGEDWGWFSYTPSISGSHFLSVNNPDIKIYPDKDMSVSATIGIVVEGETHYDYQKGQTYKIGLRGTNASSRGFNYTLTIKKPNKIIDITDYASITDSERFSFQEWTYIFTANISGTHYFGCTNKITSRVYNATSGNNIKGSGSYASYQDMGIDVDLHAGTTYKIVILDIFNCNSNFGLKINRPNEEIDISGYRLVKDQLRFVFEEIVYYFTPKESGRYYFLAEKKAVKNFREFYMYNSNDKLIGYPKNAVSLSAGQEYKISIIGQNESTFDESLDQNFEFKIFKIV